MNIKKTCGELSRTVFYLRTDLGTEQLKAGGSVAHTIGVIQGFAQIGYQVDLASSAMHDLLAQLPAQHVVPLVIPRWLYKVGFKFACLLSNVIFFLKTKSIVAQRSHAFIYQRYSLLNVVGVWLSRRYNIPLVLEYNGSEVWIDEHWCKERLVRLRFFVQWFENYNLTYAHTILVVSQALKDELVAQGVNASKIVVHPNGVDATQFDPQKLEQERHHIRTSMGLQDAVVFGFIGTFSYWHGINILAAIIPTIIRRWPQAHFLLIGDGPLRSSLQQELRCEPLCKERVHFLGTVPQAQARNYLAACDAFLSPTQVNPDGTRFFGSPTKLFEYMSLGKPVIASDIEQLAEVLSPAIKIEDLQKHSVQLGSHVGIVVKPDDVEGFVEALNFVMKLSHEQRTALGAQAREKIVAHYTWHHHVQTLVASLSE